VISKPPTAPETTPNRQPPRRHNVGLSSHVPAMHALDQLKGGALKKLYR
jgi:hypothetical protein